MPREEWAKKRDEWVAAWKKAVPDADPRAVWISMYAAAAETGDDAQEALAAMPDDSTGIWSWNGDVARANVYMLAGRVDDALPLLESATRSCEVLEDVPSLVRAEMQLGAAYEAKHDDVRACAAYAWVIQRWGAAKPSSVTGSAALARRAALRCPK
jgi:hypothetical protein